MAYKRIRFRYHDTGQLAYIHRFATRKTVVGTPSLRTVLEYDDANGLVLLAHQGTLDEGSVTPLNQYSLGDDSASRIASINSTLERVFD